ncbi:MAG TPA: hypothetical protein VFA04_26900 [Bryobacteraceae bacterium]|nr:hypothetical protein [Bryobacteraceae bacterium]
MLGVAAVGLVLRAATPAGDDYETGKARARTLLSQHRYREAVQLARELNHRMPDDLAVYGLIVDADIGLGDLADAEKQAQWMIDLGMRQPNVGGLVRVARLRMLFNDPEGALQMLGDALARTPATEAETHATLLAFGAWLELLEGNSEAALQATGSALRASAHNPCALAVAARARVAREKSIRAEDCPCDLSF